LIFDPAKGWEFSTNVVPLQRVTAVDGNANYIITLDGIQMRAFEQTKWKAGLARSVPAARLGIRTTFTGVKITNPNLLLRASYDCLALPSFGLDESGNITLQAAFPIAPGFL
jgi:hypothetical protein